MRASDAGARIPLVFAAALYVLTFYAVYVKFIVPYHGYYGFRLLSRRAVENVVSWILALLPSTFLPVTFSRPSVLVVWTMYLTVYVPSMLVPLYSLDEPFRDLLVLDVFLLVSLRILNLATRLPFLRLKRIHLPRRLFWSIFLAITIAVYIALFACFGLRPLPGIVEVYEVRLEAREIVARTGRVLGYAIRFASNVINPFLIALGLVSGRRWMGLFLGTLGSLAIYSFDATKSTLATPVILLGVWIFIRKGKLRASTLFWFFGVLVGIAGLVDAAVGSSLLTDIFVRRLVAVPGLLTGYYYEFFSTNPFFKWSHSVLAPLIANPYEYPAPSFLIGCVYFGNPAKNAGANVWADGFANFGFPGMILATVILVSYLWAYDSVARRTDMALAKLMIVVPAAALAESAILTSLLTHGLLAVLLLLLLAPVDVRTSEPVRSDERREPREGDVICE